jgi:hypothetical protein
MENKYLERAVATIFILILIGVGAFHQLLASHFHAQSTVAHGAGDWAAWLSAIGTIVAAIIALRIAGQQERTRRGIELAQANIVAARICKRLSTAHLHVQTFEAQLIFHPEGAPRQPSDLVAKDFLRAPSLSVDHSDLVALTGLGGNYATQLAYAISLLDDFKEIVARDVAHAHLMNPLPEKIAKRWENAARDIAQRIVVIQRTCEGAAKINAPEPTHEELYGDGGDNEY